MINPQRLLLIHFLTIPNIKAGSCYSSETKTTPIPIKTTTPCKPKPTQNKQQLATQQISAQPQTHPIPAELRTILINTMHESCINILSSVDTVSLHLFATNKERLFSMCVFPRFLNALSEALVKNENFYKIIASHSTTQYTPAFIEHILIYSRKPAAISRLILEELKTSKEFKALIVKNLSNDFFSSFILDFANASNNKIVFDQESYQMDLNTFSSLETYFANFNIPAEQIQKILKFLNIDYQKGDQNINNFSQQYGAILTQEMMSMSYAASIKHPDCNMQCNATDYFARTCDGYLFFIILTHCLYQQHSECNREAVENFYITHGEAAIIAITIFVHEHRDEPEILSKFPDYMLEKGANSWSERYKSYAKNNLSTFESERICRYIDRFTHEVQPAFEKRKTRIQTLKIKRPDFYKNGFELKVFLTPIGMKLIRNYQTIFFCESVLFWLDSFSKEYIATCSKINWNALCKKAADLIAQVQIDFNKNGDRQITAHQNSQQQYKLCSKIYVLLNAYINETYKTLSEHNFKGHAYGFIAPKPRETCRHTTTTLVQKNGTLCILIPYQELYQQIGEEFTKHFKYNSNLELADFATLLPLYIAMSDENFTTTIINKAYHEEQIAEEFIKYLQTNHINLTESLMLDLFVLRKIFVEFFKQRYPSNGVYNDLLLTEFFEYCIFPYETLPTKRIESNINIQQQPVIFHERWKFESTEFKTFLTTSFFNWIKLYSFAEYILFCSNPE